MNLTADDDARVREAVLPHEIEQRARVRRKQPHATVRGGTPERTGFVGAVNREIAVKENRVRHRRAMVDRRIPDALEPDRLEAAGRRRVALARGRYRPHMAHEAI